MKLSLRFHNCAQSTSCEHSVIPPESWVWHGIRIFGVVGCGRIKKDTVCAMRPGPLATLPTQYMGGSKTTCMDSRVTLHNYDHHCHPLFLALHRLWPRYHHSWQHNWTKGLIRTSSTHNDKYKKNHLHGDQLLSQYIVSDMPSHIVTFAPKKYALTAMILFCTTPLPARRDKHNPYTTALPSPCLDYPIPISSS